jgi:hypothetical protein
MWLRNKKFLVANTFCVAAMWGGALGTKLRNQGILWEDGHVLLPLVTTMLQSWIALCLKDKVQDF